LYDGVPRKKYVDIIGNVINLVAVHWASDILCGIPLKTEKTPGGAFTEQEVYEMLEVLFTCVFENVDPEHGWTLTTAAVGVGKIINNLIQQSIEKAAPVTSPNPILLEFTAIESALFPTDEKVCHAFLKRLVDGAAAPGKSRAEALRETTANVIGLAVGSSVNYSQAAAQVVDFYLDPARAGDLQNIKQIIAEDTPKNAELLRGYVREAMRLNPQYAGLFRSVMQDDSIPMGHGLPNVNVKKGDLIFASFRNAHLNPIDFPNPETVDPTRPRDSYQLQGSGFHLCPGISFTEQTIPELVKVIFRLPNLQRAPGVMGQCQSFMMNKFGTDNKMYITPTGNWSPWPGSLILTYDA